MKITKVVIPAAGFGTRFLPATKAVPKEMLPIVDKPTIQYIVEEAVRAGITDILIITGRSKKAIEDHFDAYPELENNLSAKNKTKLLEIARATNRLANIHYIRQHEMLGLGHAILQAKTFVGNDAFGIMLGDDVVDSSVPAIKQLIDIAEEKESSVIGVQKVKESDISKFGIVDVKDKISGYKDRLCSVNDFVEKPKVEDAPSDIAILGRYVVTPAVFDILERTKEGAGGEIQLTDALRVLAKQEDVYAYDFEGKRYDVGDKMGFLMATVETALKREEYKEEFKQYLQNIVKTF